MTTYIATIRHHSISRAREIEVTGTIVQAKRAASKEFGQEQRDYRIVLYAQPLNAEPYLVAVKTVGSRKWRP